MIMIESMQYQYYYTLILQCLIDPNFSFGAQLIPRKKQKEGKKITGTARSITGWYNPPHVEKGPGKIKRKQNHKLGRLLFTIKAFIDVCKEVKGKKAY